MFVNLSNQQDSSGGQRSSSLPRPSAAPMLSMGAIQICRPNAWGFQEPVLCIRRPSSDRRGQAVLVESQLPHLVALDEDDVTGTGVLIYHLDESGRTLLGADDNADIGIRGPGVAAECCSFQNVNGRLALIPHQATGILLNGTPVTEPTPLSHGDLLVLGYTNVFRFNNPIEAARLRQSCANLSSVSSVSTLSLDSAAAFLGPNSRSRYNRQFAPYASSPLAEGRAAASSTFFASTQSLNALCSSRPGAGSQQRLGFNKHADSSLLLFPPGSPEEQEVASLLEGTAGAQASDLPASTSLIDKGLPTPLAWLHAARVVSSLSSRYTSTSVVTVQRRRSVHRQANLRRTRSFDSITDLPAESSSAAGLKCQHHQDPNSVGCAKCFSCSFIDILQEVAEDLEAAAEIMQQQRSAANMPSSAIPSGYVPQAYSGGRYQIPIHVNQQQSLNSKSAPSPPLRPFVTGGASLPQNHAYLGGGGGGGGGGGCLHRRQQADGSVEPPDMAHIIFARSLRNFPPVSPVPAPLSPPVTSQHAVLLPAMPISGPFVGRRTPVVGEDQPPCECCRPPPGPHQGKPKERRPVILPAYEPAQRPRSTGRSEQTTVKADVAAPVRTSVFTEPVTSSGAVLLPAHSSAVPRRSRGGSAGAAGKRTRPAQHSLEEADAAPENSDSDNKHGVSGTAANKRRGRGVTAATAASAAKRKAPRFGVFSLTVPLPTSESAPRLCSASEMANASAEAQNLVLDLEQIETALHNQKSSVAKIANESSSASLSPYSLDMTSSSPQSTTWSTTASPQLSAVRVQSASSGVPVHMPLHVDSAGDSDDKLSDEGSFIGRHASSNTSPDMRTVGRLGKHVDDTQEQSPNRRQTQPNNTGNLVVLAGQPSSNILPGSSLASSISELDAAHKIPGRSRVDSPQSRAAAEALLDDMVAAAVATISPRSSALLPHQDQQPKPETVSSPVKPEIVSITITTHRRSSSSGTSTVVTVDSRRQSMSGASSSNGYQPVAASLMASSRRCTTCSSTSCTCSASCTGTCSCSYAECSCTTTETATQAGGHSPRTITLTRSSSRSGHHTPGSTTSMPIAFADEAEEQLIEYSYRNPDGSVAFTSFTSQAPSTSSLGASREVSPQRSIKAQSPERRTPLRTVAASAASPAVAGTDKPSISRHSSQEGSKEANVSYSAQLSREASLKMEPDDSVQKPTQIGADVLEVEGAGQFVAKSADRSSDDPLLRLCKSVLSALENDDKPDEFEVSVEYVRRQNAGHDESPGSSNEHGDNSSSPENIDSRPAVVVVLEKSADLASTAEKVRESCLGSSGWQNADSRPQSVTEPHESSIISPGPHVKSSLRGEKLQMDLPIGDETYTVIVPAAADGSLKKQNSSEKVDLRRSKSGDSRFHIPSRSEMLGLEQTSVSSQPNSQNRSMSSMEQSAKQVYRSGSEQPLAEQTTQRTGPRQTSSLVWLEDRDSRRSNRRFNHGRNAYRQVCRSPSARRSTSRDRSAAELVGSSDEESRERNTRIRHRHSITPAVVGAKFLPAYPEWRRSQSMDGTSGQALRQSVKFVHRKHPDPCQVEQRAASQGVLNIIFPSCSETSTTSTTIPARSSLRVRTSSEGAMGSNNGSKIVVSTMSSTTTFAPRSSSGGNMPSLLQRPHTIKIEQTIVKNLQDTSDKDFPITSQYVEVDGEPISQVISSRAGSMPTTIVPVLESSPAPLSPQQIVELTMSPRRRSTSAVDEIDDAVATKSSLLMKAQSGEALEPPVAEKPPIRGRPLSAKSSWSSERFAVGGAEAAGATAISSRRSSSADMASNRAPSSSIASPRRESDGSMRLETYSYEEPAEISAQQRSSQHSSRASLSSRKSSTNRDSSGSRERSMSPLAQAEDFTIGEAPTTEGRTFSRDPMMNRNELIDSFATRERPTSSLSLPSPAGDATAAEQGRVLAFGSLDDIPVGAGPNLERHLSSASSRSQSRDRVSRSVSQARSSAELSLQDETADDAEDRPSENVAQSNGAVVESWIYPSRSRSRSPVVNTMTSAPVSPPFDDDTAQGRILSYGSLEEALTPAEAATLADTVQRPAPYDSEERPRSTMLSRARSVSPSAVQPLARPISSLQEMTSSAGNLSEPEGRPSLLERATRMLSREPSSTSLRSSTANIEIPVEERVSSRPQFSGSPREPSSTGNIEIPVEERVSSRPQFSGSPREPSSTGNIEIPVEERVPSRPPSAGSRGRRTPIAISYHSSREASRQNSASEAESTQAVIASAEKSEADRTPIPVLIDIPVDPKALPYQAPERRASSSAGFQDDAAPVSQDLPSLSPGTTNSQFSSPIRRQMSDPRRNSASEIDPNQAELPVFVSVEEAEPNNRIQIPVLIDAHVSTNQPSENLHRQDNERKSPLFHSEIVDEPVVLDAHLVEPLNLPEEFSSIGSPPPSGTFSPEVADDQVSPRAEMPQRPISLFQQEEVSPRARQGDERDRTKSPSRVQFQSQASQSMPSSRSSSAERKAAIPVGSVGLPSPVRASSLAGELEIDVPIGDETYTITLPTAASESLKIRRSSGDVSSPFEETVLQEFQQTMQRPQSAGTPGKETRGGSQRTLTPTKTKPFEARSASLSPRSGSEVTVTTRSSSMEMSKKQGNVGSSASSVAVPSLLDSERRGSDILPASLSVSSRRDTSCSGCSTSCTSCTCSATCTCTSCTSSSIPSTDREPDPWSSRRTSYSIEALSRRVSRTEPSITISLDTEATMPLSVQRSSGETDDLARPSSSQAQRPGATLRPAGSAGHLPESNEPASTESSLGSTVSDLQITSPRDILRVEELLRPASANDALLLAGESSKVISDVPPAYPQVDVRYPAFVSIEEEPIQQLPPTLSSRGRPVDRSERLQRSESAQPKAAQPSESYSKPSTSPRSSSLSRLDPSSDVGEILASVMQTTEKLTKQSTASPASLSEANQQGVSIRSRPGSLAKSLSSSRSSSAERQKSLVSSKAELVDQAFQSPILPPPGFGGDDFLASAIDSSSIVEESQRPVDVSLAEYPRRESGLGGSVDATPMVSNPRDTLADSGLYEMSLSGRRDDVSSKSPRQQIADSSELTSGLQTQSPQPPSRTEEISNIGDEANPISAQQAEINKHEQLLMLLLGMPKQLRAHAVGRHLPRSMSARFDESGSCVGKSLNRSKSADPKSLPYQTPERRASSSASFQEDVVTASNDLPSLPPGTTNSQFSSPRRRQMSDLIVDQAGPSVFPAATDDSSESPLSPFAVAAGFAAREGLSASTHDEEESEGMLSGSAEAAPMQSLVDRLADENMNTGISNVPLEPLLRRVLLSEGPLESVGISGSVKSLIEPENQLTETVEVDRADNDDAKLCWQWLHKHPVGVETETEPSDSALGRLRAVQEPQRISPGVATKPPRPPSNAIPPPPIAFRNPVSAIAAASSDSQVPSSAVGGPPVGNVDKDEQVPRDVAARKSQLNAEFMSLLMEASVTICALALAGVANVTGLGGSSTEQGQSSDQASLPPSIANLMRTVTPRPIRFSPVVQLVATNSIIASENDDLSEEGTEQHHIEPPSDRAPIAEEPSLLRLESTQLREQRDFAQPMNMSPNKVPRAFAKLTPPSLMESDVSAQHQPSTYDTDRTVYGQARTPTLATSRMSDANVSGGFPAIMSSSTSLSLSITDVSSSQEPLPTLIDSCVDITGNAALQPRATSAAEQTLDIRQSYRPDVVFRQLSFGSTLSPDPLTVKESEQLAKSASGSDGRSQRHSSGISEAAELTAARLPTPQHVTVGTSPIDPSFFQGTFGEDEGERSHSIAIGTDELPSSRCRAIETDAQVVRTTAVGTEVGIDTTDMITHGDQEANLISRSYVDAFTEPEPEAVSSLDIHKIEPTDVETPQNVDVALGTSDSPRFWLPESSSNMNEWPEEILMRFYQQYKDDMDEQAQEPVVAEPRRDRQRRMSSSSTSAAEDAAAALAQRHSRPERRARSQGDRRDMSPQVARTASEDSITFVFVEPPSTSEPTGTTSAICGEPGYTRRRDHRRYMSESANSPRGATDRRQLPSGDRDSMPYSPGSSTGFREAQSPYGEPLGRQEIVTREFATSPGLLLSEIYAEEQQSPSLSQRRRSSPVVLDQGVGDNDVLMGYRDGLWATTAVQTELVEEALRLLKAGEINIPIGDTSNLNPEWSCMAVQTDAPDDERLQDEQRRRIAEILEALEQRRPVRRARSLDNRVAFVSGVEEEAESEFPPVQFPPRKLAEQIEKEPPIAAAERKETGTSASPPPPPPGFADVKIPLTSTKSAVTMTDVETTPAPRKSPPAPRRQPRVIEIPLPPPPAPVNIAANAREALSAQLSPQSRRRLMQLLGYPAQSAEQQGDSSKAPGASSKTADEVPKVALNTTSPKWKQRRMGKMFTMQADRDLKIEAFRFERERELNLLSADEKLALVDAGTEAVTGLSSGTPGSSTSNLNLAAAAAAAAAAIASGNARPPVPLMKPSQLCEYHRLLRCSMVELTKRSESAMSGGSPDYPSSQQPPYSPAILPNVVELASNMTRATSCQVLPSTASSTLTTPAVTTASASIRSPTVQQSKIVPSNSGMQQLAINIQDSPRRQNVPQYQQKQYHAPMESLASLTNNEYQRSSGATERAARTAELQKAATEGYQSLLMVPSRGEPLTSTSDQRFSYGNSRVARDSSIPGSVSSGSSRTASPNNSSRRVGDAYESSRQRVPYSSANQDERLAPGGATQSFYASLIGSSPKHSPSRTQPSQSVSAVRPAPLPISTMTTAPSSYMRPSPLLGPSSTMMPSSSSSYRYAPQSNIRDNEMQSNYNRLPSSHSQYSGSSYPTSSAHDRYRPQSGSTRQHQPSSSNVNDWGEL